MLGVLSCRGGAFTELARRQMLFAAGIANLAVLGLLYGLTGAGVSHLVLARLDGGAGAAFSPLAVTVVGLVAVFLIHGAAVLFLWVFCRGLGGRRQLAPHYLNMAAACIALWPAAPAVVLFQAGLGGVAALAVAALFGAWGGAVLMVAVRAASGLSPVKTAVAVTAALIYAGCFLYLWI
jgi:hypothetical protein